MRHLHLRWIQAELFLPDPTHKSGRPATEWGAGSLLLPSSFSLEWLSWLRQCIFVPAHYGGRTDRERNPSDEWFIVSPRKRFRQRPRFKGEIGRAMSDRPFDNSFSALWGESPFSLQCFMVLRHVETWILLQEALIKFIKVFNCTKLCL